MNAIVSVTQDWGIGYQGQLLVRNPVDMRYFKDHTMGGTVICGQTTFESFPGGALEGRRNIVLTWDENFSAPGVEAVYSLEEALAAVASEDPNSVWIIGGQSIYQQLIDACTYAYVTLNDIVLPADAYFPNLDANPNWVLDSVEPGGITKGGIPFNFALYRHI